MTNDELQLLEERLAPLLEPLEAIDITRFDIMDDENTPRGKRIWTLARATEASQQLRSCLRSLRATR